MDVAAYAHQLEDLLTEKIDAFDTIPWSVLCTVS